MPRLRRSSKSEPTPEEELQDSVDKSFREKKLVIPNPKRLRNLTQYRNMTDEEFQEVYQRAVLNIEPDQMWEARIQEKYKEYEDAYDLDDLKPNDISNLMTLIKAQLRLEDYDAILNSHVKSITFDNLGIVEKVSKAASDLRSTISKIEEDLKITRKIRKSDQEESALKYIDFLKKKAQEFYRQKMFYIFCPECHMLLATLWSQYPDYRGNSMNFTCHRDLGNDQFCSGRVSITTKDLLDNKGSNLPEIMPESIR